MGYEQSSTTSPARLAESCRETRALALDATRWLGADANATSVGRERDSMVRVANRAATRANRLEKAALRPMCVGVFGPSQAGKSYLVEVLARPDGGTLRARFDGHESVDFLAAINPTGEKESTGLVTRFTSRPAPLPAPANAPVCLRTLTEPDLVKILGNTFFMDGDQTKEISPTSEHVSALLNECRTASTGKNARFDAEDLGDIQDYFQKQFGGARSIEALSGYWVEARRIAPSLDVAGRAQLFSPLWGGHEPFTRLFRELAGALERLGHPSEVFAPMAALLPRDGSVLDVATLAGLGAASGDLLRLTTASGVEADLPRPVVAALTAELRIETADASRAFLREADLLDFPGARSRQKVHLAAFLAEHPDALKETFLRGKVAYLFDRYVAEQELTAMLLCVRPSNQEVVTLPDLVEDWIASTHGRTPEVRAASPTLLFLVMTWFDTHFIDKAGDAGQDSGLRFRNRIEASLLGFFGKAHGWPRRWTPDTPFRNAFWFRNPNYPAEGVIRYEGRREVEVLPEKQDRLRQLRQGFLDLPEAQAHFHDPGRAFDEALRLNDGGVSYLVENLAKVCRPELKIGQVSARLDELRAELREQLGRFHVSTDLGERLAERREAAGRVFDALDGAAASDGFGSLLRCLVVDTAVLADALVTALGARAASTPAIAAPRGPSRIARPGVVRPGASAGAPPIVQRDNPGGGGEGMLARAAFEAWINALRAALEEGRLQRRFALPGDVAATIVDELVGLARRADIEGRIAADLRMLSSVEKAEQSTLKAALIASTRLNRLIGGLGFTSVPPVGTPPAVPDDEAERPAFAPRPVAFDAWSIGEQAQPFAHRYATDWFHGFYAAVESNASAVDGVTVNLDENEKLRVILDGLRPAHPRESMQIGGVS